jgi:hypothetical protein
MPMMYTYDFFLDALRQAEAQLQAAPGSVDADNILTLWKTAMKEMDDLQKLDDGERYVGLKKLFREVDKILKLEEEVYGAEHKYKRIPFEQGLGTQGPGRKLQYEQRNRFLIPLR